MEIAWEGWLRKAPVEKRFFRSKWEARWFVLKAGDLPGQYLLEYYTDQSYKKLKGKVDLDQCRQVDINQDPAHPEQALFSIKTLKRTYYLAAPSQADLNRWIQAICSVCDLRIQRDTNTDHLSSTNHNQSTASNTALNNDYATSNQQNQSTSSALNQLSITSSYCNNTYLDSIESSSANRPSLSSSNSSSPAISTPQSQHHRPIISGTIPKNHRFTNNHSFSNNSFSTLPAPPRRTVCSSGPYIPISECHTGKSIFHVNRQCSDSSDSKSAYFDFNKENNEENLIKLTNALNKGSKFAFNNSDLLDQSVDCSHSESLSTSINYDVPRSSISKSNNHNAIVLTNSSPSSQSLSASQTDENMYANSLVCNNEINQGAIVDESDKPAESFANQCNSSVNSSNSTGPPSIPPPPPPRPPKPAFLSYHSNSACNMLNQVPNTKEIDQSINQSIDQMYSIPKPNAQAISSHLDAIVPLSSDTNTSPSAIRSYSNAPSSSLTNSAEQMLTYEYKPNLPLFSDHLNDSLLNTSATDMSLHKPQSYLAPQTPTTPNTMFIPIEASSQTSQSVNSANTFKFSESVADLHDVFGPPMVNRQLKPKKVTCQTNQCNSVKLINQIPLSNSLQKSCQNAAPRIPSRGRQFVKKDNLSNKFFEIDCFDKNQCIDLLEPENEIQYLDLDLDGANVSTCVSNSDADANMSNNQNSDLTANTGAHQQVTSNNQTNKSNNFNCSPSIAGTVYKTVDFVKTKAFNDVRAGIHRKIKT